MPAPLLTVVTYRARAGCEEELAGVLRTRVARLRELGLVAGRPHFAAQVRGAPGRFVASFWWAHEGAPALADDHSEVQELWRRVEDLCAEGGIETALLDVLD